MQALLSAAGRAFLRVFGGSLLTFAILAASSWTPDKHLHDLLVIGAGALAAAVAAGIRALQAYVPQLSVARYLTKPWGDLIDSFLHGFLGTLVVALPGALEAPNLSAGEGIAVAAIVGALTAGLRAVQGSLTPGDKPGAGKGLPAPPNP